MPVETIASIAALRSRRADVRRSGRTVGLVPTMGALHAGHERLIEQARRESDCVVVSIFVNPIQFDRQDDLQRYPRTLDADRAVCERLGVDLIFAPTAEEMYPEPPQLTVDVGPLGDHLCGPFRPGHFRGVATVVLKLFEIVQPDRAYFGEKDAQQLAIIRRLVRDLNVPTAIAGVATVREADGLALSSRNQRLSADERRLATALFQALREAERQIGAGERDPAVIRERAAARIPSSPHLRLEYLEIVDPDSLQPAAVVQPPVRVAGALWVGSTRLIDNLLIA